ncbi:MAG: hypothetical protein QOI14_1748 [Actinomycetota bacterium]|nr:hypothetical protein [Actinomycetota bacterium]
MRSSVPIPGNPWPHDMVITIDDPHELVDLLWIRETWNLRPVGEDLPPALSDKPVSEQAQIESFDQVAKWQGAWPSIWDACVKHQGLLRDEGMFDRLHQTAGGSAERAELLRTLFGPSWREEFGAEAFTDQYDTWSQARFESESRRRGSRSVDEEPERVSLSALIAAWRGGLSKIVTIPCRGTYTRVIGRHVLLVTEETRKDPRRYSEALKQFH